MARNRDKYCDCCGYPTHKLYFLPSWGWPDGRCADCLLDEMNNATDCEEMAAQLREARS